MACNTGNRMKVEKFTSEKLAQTNRVMVNSKEFQASVRHVVVKNENLNFFFTIEPSDEVPPNVIAFSLIQRKWARLSINQEVEVRPYIPNHGIYMTTIVLVVDYLRKKGNPPSELLDSDRMAADFLTQFREQVFCKGQIFVLPISEKEKILEVEVKQISVSDYSGTVKSGKEAKVYEENVGVCFSQTAVKFEKHPASTLLLTGKAKGKSSHQSIINPDWDFAKMGIGGLDTEFNAIFRRAFASRVFPPEVMEQLGCKHVKGILLFGPPGTGKTLMARQIGKMLNAKEPKIVNGPQILDKYVGESEANIRRLFADAEEEEKKMGANSGLHIIIFDEIDAICKTRGSVAGNTGVNDTVVNQLLAKIDGVEQLNNILVIGMTNRRDMMDEALLRPGRLEVQMEIGLPDEFGRQQILNIHTTTMRDNKKLGNDVRLEELATLTKNFSGAEIEGLVRAAQSTALNRHIKASSKVEVDPDASEKIKVTRADFIHSLEHDVKPAFGTAFEQLDTYLSRGIIDWGSPVQDVLQDGDLLVQQVKNLNGGGVVSVLIEGAPNTGKTALAAQIAKNSNFPFVKICTPEDMVGYTESAKCLQIRKVFDDAYKSELSLVLVDNVERLLDYGAIGPRYSNLVLQALLVLLKKNPPKGRKLLIICTTSRRDVLRDLEVLSAFAAILHLSSLTTSEHVLKVLCTGDIFSRSEIQLITKKTCNGRFFVGIKKLLDLVDMTRQIKDDFRVAKFLCKLEEEGCLEMENMGSQL